MSKMVFETLEKAKNKKFILKSEAYTFFKNFRGMLKTNPNFLKYLDCENDFDVLKANIIIKSIINKEEFDSIIADELLLTRNQKSISEIKESIKERTSDLPYMTSNKQKIYMPFFNRTTNSVYTDEIEKMEEYPYIELNKKFDSFLIDPFETYGFNLYDSLFTELVKIDEDATTEAYYYYDFNAIFIVNNQGGLDNIIYLFDKYMLNPHKNDIIEKIKPLIRAYYKNDLVQFIYLLYKNNLVSYYIFRKITKLLSL